MADDFLVMHGGEVKVLGNGKIGGYLVRFSGPDDPDLDGDFFTKDTDFSENETSLVFYQHGLDGTLKRRVLDPKATLKKDEFGIWVEAQLQLRDEYERFIYQRAKEGKQGWSSGTASHLVEREQVGKAYWIKSWPLGLDASLTPTPAEPRNVALSLKSIVPIETFSVTLAERLARLTEDLQSLEGDMQEFTKAITRPLSATKRREIEAMLESCSSFDVVRRSLSEVLEAHQPISVVDQKHTSYKLDLLRRRYGKE